jgi:hypothetical protein
MKKLFIVFIIVSLVGCGGSNFKSNKVTDYLDKFQQETCIDVSNVNVTVCDATPDNRSGYTTVGVPKVILLLDNTWNSFQDYQKEIQLAHELMHYLFKIANHNNKIINEEAESLMNEYAYNNISRTHWIDGKAAYYRPFYKLAKQQGQLVKDCVPLLNF